MTPTLISMFIAVISAGGQTAGSYSIQGFDTVAACNAQEIFVKSQVQSLHHSSAIIKTKCIVVPNKAELTSSRP